MSGYQRHIRCLFATFKLAILGAAFANDSSPAVLSRRLSTALDPAAVPVSGPSQPSYASAAASPRYSAMISPMACWSAVPRPR
jgi:hypothetical protein